MEFSEKGIAVRYTEVKSELAWTFFPERMETDRFFRLILAKRGIPTLPKRVFAGEEEIGRFRELLRSQLPGAPV